MYDSDKNINKKKEMRSLFKNTVTFSILHSFKIFPIFYILNCKKYTMLKNVKEYQDAKENIQSL